MFSVKIGVRIHIGTDCCHFCKQRRVNPHSACQASNLHSANVTALVQMELGFCSDAKEHCVLTICSSSKKIDILVTKHTALRPQETTNTTHLSLTHIGLSFLQRHRKHSLQCIWQLLPDRFKLLAVTTPWRVEFNLSRTR